MAHTVLLQRLVCCIPMLLGNSQFLTPLPYGTCPLHCTQGNVGILYLGSDFEYPDQRGGGPKGFRDII